MSDAPPPEDPFRAMREAYDQAIAGWSKAMEEMVGSEEFASSSGEFLKRYVETQEALRGASRTTAESLHLPTVDDLARLAEMVINVERKLDELTERAEEISERLAAIDARLTASAPRPAARARRSGPSAR